MSILGMFRSMAAPAGFLPFAQQIVRKGNQSCARQAGKMRFRMNHFLFTFYLASVGWGWNSAVFRSIK